VVSDEVSAAVILTRLAGFYPQAAAEQYEIIKLSTRMTDYQKEVSAGFRQAWIKAMVRNDMDQARSIVEAVNDWNDGAQGTALEIKNFEANARKALREATRPASERLLKSAPKGAREDIDQVTQLFGY
jgi:polysaccharide pyruvyl transferase WcaK-like protein